LARHNCKGATELPCYLTAGLVLACRGQEDDEEEAIAYFRKALEIEPKCYVERDIRASAYANLGVALVKRKQTNEGMAYFYKALAIMPRCSLAHYNLGTIF